MGWRFRFRYDVCQAEFDGFVSENECVANFLAKYKGSDTAEYYGRCLCRFFKWLRMVRGLNISPSEFLTLLASKRGSGDPLERAWGKNLALAFSRDNADLKGKADTYIYSQFFLPIRKFCAYHEVELTSDMGVFGRKKKRYLLLP